MSPPLGAGLAAEDGHTIFGQNGQRWEHVQERNLQYVAVTRTRDALVLLPLLED